MQCSKCLKEIEAEDQGKMINGRPFHSFCFEELAKEEQQVTIAKQDTCPDGKCNTCTFFVANLPLASQITEFDKIGECHKNAPVAGHGFALTDTDEWCGKYKYKGD